MRSRGDRLSWIAVLIGAAAVVAWWLIPRAVLVETAPVTTGRFIATVDEDGKTRIRERYIVAAPLAGQSTRVRFKELPVVASLSMKSLTVNAFLEKIANLVLVSAGILTAFAVIIAAGVVYNAARIALQERAWELASLRVLGFTRDEVSRLLFAELAIELALGIPIGFVFSRQLIDLLARVHSGETFQVPPIIGASTYGMAALVVLAAAIASGLVVRRQIDRLDLVSALKTRE